MRRLTTISAMLLLMGLALAGLRVSTSPPDDYNIIHLGGSDDWSIEDHYYEPPIDPATAGNWGERTPVKYVAASDSSYADQEFVVNQGENGYQCDGENDDEEINDAIKSVGLAGGGGKVFLFEGNYNIGKRISLMFTFLSKGNFSLVGADRENTIIRDATSGLFAICATDLSPPNIVDNILIENLTLVGAGRSITGEHLGIFPYGNSIVIRNCLMENFSSIGVYMFFSTILRDIWVIDCEVRNTGGSGISFHNTTVSIENVYVINNTIVNCGIGSPHHETGGYGVAFRRVKHGLVVNNTIENSGRNGIFLSRTEDVLVQGNSIVNSGSFIENAGIWLRGKSDWVTENIIIRGNEILDNQAGTQNYGIEFYNKHVENCVVDNNYISNHEYGIHITSSPNNTIYHNHFVNNTTQAYDDGTNQWDNGYPSGGNYWSDYVGVDENQGEDQDIPGPDGIGDTPYTILGDSNQDRYPLVTPVIIRGVEVSISPDYQSGVPCTTLDYTITVKNTGNVEDTYDLILSDNAGWGDNVTLDDYLLVVPAGENRTTTLHVHVPDDAIGCTEDNITITARSQENTEVENEASCIAHVAVSRGVTVSISPNNQSGVPCTTLDYTVTVKNTGNVQENYTLAKSDDAGWGDDVMLDNDWLVVQPSENQTTTLHVHIPDDAVACTEDNITVTATSKDNIEAENSVSCVAHAIAEIIRGVNVLIEPGYQSALAGESIEFTVTVINTGNVSDTYDLEATDNADPGWNLTLQDNLEVPASENREATLTVTIPSGAENCTRDNITVTATSVENIEVSDNASCVTHAVTERIVRMDVEISPGYQWKENGGTLTYTITVTNRGTVSDTYDLKAGNDAGWAPTVSPESLSLAVGASGTATLTVTIPGDAENCTEDNITVTATSQENTAIENSASCVAHCLVGVPPPLYGVEVSISPPENEGSPDETVTFTVTVTNLGSAQDSFDLTVGDDLNWAPTLDENLLANLTAGDSQTTTLRVTIPENAEACTRDNIRVRATSQGDNTVSAEGSCTAHAVIIGGVSRWPLIIGAIIATTATATGALVARHLKKRKRKKRRRAEARRLKRLKGLIEGEE
jgi:parallel beta-helix repeat protein